MLILPAEFHQLIRAHGAASYPQEGCGLLLGEARDGVNVVRAARPLPNVWPVEREKPKRFQKRRPVGKPGAARDEKQGTPRPSDPRRPVRGNPRFAKPAGGAPLEEMRIAKALARAGLCSRREA